MLKCSGAWVSPVEIENVLIEHAAVQEAAVIGRQDQDSLLKPMACIVLKNGKPDDPELARELQEFV
jgi:benzoate-CoA ligase